MNIILVIFIFVKKSRMTELYAQKEIFAQNNTNKKEQSAKKLASAIKPEEIKLPEKKVGKAWDVRENGFNLSADLRRCERIVFECMMNLIERIPNRSPFRGVEISTKNRKNVMKQWIDRFTDVRPHPGVKEDEADKSRVWLDGNNSINAMISGKHESTKRDYRFEGVKGNLWMSTCIQFVNEYKSIKSKIEAIKREREQEEEK